MIAEQGEARDIPIESALVEVRKWREGGDKTEAKDNSEEPIQVEVAAQIGAAVNKKKFKRKKKLKKLERNSCFFLLGLRGAFRANQSPRGIFLLCPPAAFPKILCAKRHHLIAGAKVRTCVADASEAKGGHHPRREARTY